MVVLITGVSSGFGKAMALRLAMDGHKVYGTVRRETEQLNGVTYLEADVQDEAAVASAFGRRRRGVLMCLSAMPEWG